MEQILEALRLLLDEWGKHPLFAVGTLLVIGYFIGKLSGKIKLPEITGYIIAGLILGESVTGIIHPHMGEALKTITEVALGLIAVTIGGEFYLSKLKRMGKGVIIITLVQILLTFSAVTAGLFIFQMDLPRAILLGAVATATAPAATVAIVQALRAQGPFVDYLYGVVALDDAGCVVVFGVAMAIVSGVMNPVMGSAGVFSVIAFAFLEIVFSVLLGAAIGFLIHILAGKRKSSSEVLIITLGLVFLATGISVSMHLSPLLTNMAVGTMIINLNPRNHQIFRTLEPLTPPIYALFFVIAGTELQPGIIFNQHILIAGSVYILIRAISKYFGVFAGAAMARCQPKIRNYLGFCMVPQAGVAIGLVLLIQASPLGEILSLEKVEMMVNIVLLSVFINELIGPVLSRFAVVRGNDMES